MFSLRKPSIKKRSFWIHFGQENIFGKTKVFVWLRRTNLHKASNFVFSSGIKILVLYFGNKIGSCSSGVAFWVTQVGWHVDNSYLMSLSMKQFVDWKMFCNKTCFYYPYIRGKYLFLSQKSPRKNKYILWALRPFLWTMKGIKLLFLKLQSYVRGQNWGIWDWPT